MLGRTIAAVRSRVSCRFSHPISPMSKLGVRYAAAIACIGLTQASCGNPLVPIPEIMGHTYALLSINGEELPIRTWEDSSSYNQLIADTLVFLDADSVAYFVVSRFVTPTSDDTSSYTITRAYKQPSKETLLITKECPPISCSCIEDYEETGVFFGDTLVTNVSMYDWDEERVFVRVNGG